MPESLNTRMLISEGLTSNGDSDAAYRTTAYVDGGASRNARATGNVVSDDGWLNTRLRIPRKLGGPGSGTNPEQLFAAALAASFHAELSAIAISAGLDPRELLVDATVSLHDARDGEAKVISTTIEVNWPGTALNDRRELIDQASTRCPYTKMTRQGATVTVQLVADQ